MTLREGLSLSGSQITDEIKFDYLPFFNPKEEMFITKINLVLIKNYENKSILVLSDIGEGLKIS